MSTHRRIFSTWIAILAVLLNALVPTVSLAFEPDPTPGSAVSGGWIEMCTSQGSSWVKLDTDGQISAQTSQRPEGAPAATHNGHCPYCLTHAASFGLPPASVALLPVWLTVTDLLPQSTPLVVDTRGWRVPAARAPPSIL